MRALLTLATACLALVLHLPSASADEPEEGAEPSPVELHFHGYGDLLFSFYDFGPDRTRDGGSQRDARLVFDTARFVLEAEVELPHDFEVEAEIEFEHGGTGGALELEYEEFGEYEREVEAGGEVLLEELYVKKTFADRFSVKLGRFYVAVGLLSRAYRPTDYLATTRPEAEVTVIPAVWDEMGIAFEARWPRLRLTAQVINGLDSTGFGSERFIATGHQRRFELVRATDLAGVARVDVAPIEGVEVGVSAYYGDTTRNRPKPDLVRTCEEANPDAVAPCGYVSAPLLLLDAHAQVALGPVRGSAMALWGRLENADAISSRNERLSNALGVPRTPVADQALAVWAEVGLDVAPWLGLDGDHRLEPYVRLDHYDTMFRVRSGLFDNPRFERTVLTGGVGYTLSDALVFKLDASRRWFGSSALHRETTVSLATGFVY